MLRAYINKNLGASKLAAIATANEIIAEYAADGYDLTLRQLYYQFVARGLMPNDQKEYKRLGETINDGRLCGLIDWYAIVDRTRNLAALPHWDDPADIIKSATDGFALEKWDTQPYRVEVWIEKEALAGVFERVCSDLDVAYFACRGYVSQSEMWRAAQRLIRYERAGQETRILHFGDHDPSGIDMTRDIRDRLHLFGSDVDVDRIALNMDQVEEYNPPPNPTKLTDSRANDYVAEFGYESWELDALDPSVLSDLVRTEIDKVLDQDKWDNVVEIQEQHRADLSLVSDNWDDVAQLARDNYGSE